MSHYRWHFIFRVAVLPLFAASTAHPLGRQELTAAPRGPLHIERNYLVDNQGQPFLIRGTQLPAFGTRYPAKSGEFEPHSATVFSTIRQRWNMNAVRLPLNLADYAGDPLYLQKVSDVVRRANGLELLVILSVPGLSVHGQDQLPFWRHAAAFFRNYPELIFELDSGPLQPSIDAIRAAGASQPVLVAGPEAVDDGNAIYLVSPSYRAARTDADRDRDFGSLAMRVPVLASGLDPALDLESGECAAFPADPSDAEALVEATLNYLDTHRISWVASEFQPGKLIGDLRHMYPSTLENGWTCGHASEAFAGIGEMIQFHLWGGDLRGLFAVSAAGGFVLPRGGIVIVYGGIFAERDTRNSLTPPPTELGDVSVLITDRNGVARRAGLLYVSAGWGRRISWCLRTAPWVRRGLRLLAATGAASRRRSKLPMSRQAFGPTTRTDAVRPWVLSAGRASPIAMRGVVLRFRLHFPRSPAPRYGCSAAEFATRPRLRMCG